MTSIPTITSSTSLTTTSSPSPSGYGTCPTIYLPGHPVSYATFTRACEGAQSSVLDSNYYDYTDRCLGDWCDAVWSSAIQSYIDANITQSTTSTRTWFQGYYGTGSLSTVITGQSYWTSTYTYVQNPFRAVKPTSPCCHKCTISAQTIQLFFWPSSAAAPPPTVTGLPADATAAVTGVPVNGSGSYVDDTGFTFISPSVYLGFTSLGAHDRCGPVGEALYNTTLAFDPREISSILPYTTTATCIVTVPLSQGGYTITVWENSMPNPQPLTYSDVAQNCSSIDGYYYFSKNPFYNSAGDPCHPVVAIPTRVQQLQPAWSSCGADYYGGFYDPPKTLQQGPVLVPTAEPGQGNPTVVPSTSVPALPENAPTRGPDPPVSSFADSGNLPPASSAVDPGNQPPPASQTQKPAPPMSQPEQPPQASSARDQEQPVLPPPGSSTTIVIAPPSSEQSNGNPQQPSAAPVITLGPAPGLSNPGQVITLLPTVVPTSPSSPSNSNQLNNPSGPVIIIGTQTVGPGQAITVGGTTSTLPNGQTTVISGTQIFLVPGASQVIVGGSSTINLPPAQLTKPPAVVTLDGSTFTANSVSQIIIGSQTLTPGGIITIGGITSTLIDGSTTITGGTIISLAPGATEIVVGGTTIQLTAGPHATSGPLVITLDRTTLTADSLTQFVFGSSTLSMGGPALTISGTTYSLTTNVQGSTVLIAGTAGASTLAPARATTAAASMSIGSTRVSIGSQGSARGSATLAAPHASNTGAAGTFKSHNEWVWSVLLGFAMTHIL
ncbi:uncharacterized protein BDR25DRAFT_344171 [Lindgomyces ingoldianus]|uniref:Uncharacterized protein n=1 Tax=Lindgomyces ingoldianus TaxID=673940 RepID=A0ACB6QPR1_9PLEO|nr:uncharacterized protein BDR25DRAFT_344171 [Lindgomyces ingoldianus]KAF2468988.1 hypothetical protein BDR25DRAFT_344171 [Lindgomyces ingoldianus]